MTEFGQIIKNPLIESFELIISKEFNGSMDGLSKMMKGIKPNQTFVNNIWTDNKLEEYPCICPQGPASLCGNKFE